MWQLRFRLALLVPCGKLMHVLSPQQMETLRVALLDEATRLNRRLGSLERGEESESRVDAQERAQQEAARVQDTNMLAHDRRRLRDVEAALRRMDAGSYGICEDTGDPIPYERLRSQPTATLTAEAQADRELESERAGEEGDREAY